MLDHRLGHRGFRRHVVAVGVDADLFHRIGFFAGQRVKFRDAFQFLAKERQPPCADHQGGRERFPARRPAPGTCRERTLIVAFVLLGDQIGDDLR